MERYLPIDEEGYFVFDGRRVDDEELGGKLLKNIRVEEKNQLVTELNGEPAFLEAFDEPLIARHLAGCSGGKCKIDLPYHTQMEFSLDTLSVDEWDRFHGRTTDNVPFVFSRAAQVEFFDALDEFDDESITVEGKTYPTPPWLNPVDDRGVNQSQFWSAIYTGETPPWELGRESAILPSVLPQLKLTKSRVLVLGAGSGHDAAYFARQGHVVTAVDFSEEAVKRMKANYSGFENMKIVHSDIFELPSAWAGNFDLVFEHTCYCALAPERRNDLVKLWHKMLSPQGHMLGVFFAMDKRDGPPFGGSEWEIRERLKSRFQFLLWNRWRHSLDGRKGKELVVYAAKRAL